MWHFLIVHFTAHVFVAMYTKEQFGGHFLGIKTKQSDGLFCVTGYQFYKLTCR